MNKKTLFLLKFIALIFLIGTAKAADIESALDAKGISVGLLSGNIGYGDTQRVAKFYLKYPSIQFLRLDSRGGDVIEAVRLGELVRTLRLQVQVADRGVCASSCFFVWINGAFRLAAPEGYKGGSGPIGLHRPFLIGPENNEESLQRQSDVIAGVRSYLESNFIPRRLIDIMMSRPSNDIYWLTNNDLDELSSTPPALEELYLSKCQANVRQLSAQRFQAVVRHDSVEVKQIDARLGKVFTCTGILDWDAHNAALKKMASGWLPPIPFSRKK